MKIIDIVVIGLLVALSLIYIINKIYQSIIRKKTCAGCTGKCLTESCPALKKNLKDENMKE